MSPENTEHLIAAMAGTGQEIDQAQVTGVVILIDELVAEGYMNGWDAALAWAYPS